MKVVTYNTLSYFWQAIKAKLNLKYDKAGGEVTGDVKIDGNLTLDIPDEDYTAGITFSKALDTNAGTILTVTGFANSQQENTNYKTVIRNVASPINNYDAANKAYVDALIVRPSAFLVALANDGTIDTVTSTLKYDTVKAQLTNYTTDVFLDVVYMNSRFHVPAIQDQDVNAGPIVFSGDFTMANGSFVDIRFFLDSNDTLTNVITARENALLKVNSVSSYSNSQLHYPTTKAVFDEFQRKPVVIWETDGTGLVALNTDIAQNMNWQLTGLDFSPYKRIKIHAKAGKGSTNTTREPAKFLEMYLDPRGADMDFGHYVGSTNWQNENNKNRLGTFTCAVSADLTSFCYLRNTSIYGTAGTDTNNGGNVYLIEGFFD